jgi:ribosome-associated toxin RatA of RatAB toxin-antitoxin module
MAKITKSALLEAPIELAYQVVQAVEDYPDFLPGCDAVEVLKRSDHGLQARVSVKGAGLSEVFVTENMHDPTSISMSLKEGSFQSLNGVWHFSQIGDQGCRVNVEIEYEVGGMLAIFFLPIADMVANKLVDAFCQRITDVQAGGRDLGQ